MLHEDNLIWIDLEMTGLDPDRDSILEIATVVTDKDLNLLAEGPEFALRHPLAQLEAMDDWNRNQHRKSGLWTRVLESTIDMGTAEALTVEFLDQWVPTGKSPMCGNSICQDRRFMHRLMPRLERYFHYRNLDVSTIKEIARRWAPDLSRGLHQGIDAYRAARRARFDLRAQILPAVHGPDRRGARSALTGCDRNLFNVGIQSSKARRSSGIVQSGCARRNRRRLSVACWRRPC